MQPWVCGRASGEVGGEWDRAASTKGLHWFSLRFRNQKTEQEFTRHAVHGLRFWLFWASLGVVSLLLMNEFSALVLDHEPECKQGGGAAFTPRRIVLRSIFVALMLFNMAISCFRRVFERARFVLLEGYVVANAIGLLISIVLMQGGTQLEGRNFCNERPSHANFIRIIFVTTGAHLSPHIRWHVMIPFQMFAMLVICFFTAHVYADDGVSPIILSTIQLGCLVAMASQGKRMMEVRERQNFANLIVERTSRVQSEFQLSRVRSASGATRPDDVASSTGDGSVPTTTETGMVFQIGGVEVGEPLDALRELGHREQWLVNKTSLHWKAEDILGVGGFGIVVKGQYQGISVAVKVPKASLQTTRSTSFLAELCNELQIVRRLRHPNIVGFYGACVDERLGDLALVLEVVDGVSLRSFVQQSSNALDRAHVLLQISCALLYLHTQHPRIVHSDLKDTNIFVVNHNGSNVSASGSHLIKLLDFGLSRRLTKNARPSGGSLLWAAPEVVKGGRRPATAADVYSFGCIVYFVLTGHAPGEGKSRSALLADLKTGVVPTLVWPDDTDSNKYRNIVDSCMLASATLRPGMATVHDTVLGIWESCGSQVLRNGGITDLLREIRVLRTAATQWVSHSQRQGNSGGGTARGWLGRANTSAGAATPPPALPEEMPGRPSPSANVGGDTPLLFPGFERTPMDTQVSMLAPVLARCNIEIPTDACCQFHASVQNLKRVIGIMATFSCRIVSLQAAGQCATCGAVVTEDDVNSWGASGPQFTCDVCGECGLLNSTHPT